MSDSEDDQRNTEDDRGRAHLMNDINLATNVNLNLNSQNLLSGFNANAVLRPSQSFLNRGVFQQRGMQIQRDLTLGGQLSHLSHLSHPLSMLPMQMPMQVPMQLPMPLSMQMQGASHSGSISLLAGNNNALDVHLIQRQLAEQRLVQQLVQQRMLRNRYPALLQSLAGMDGMALHAQINPSLGLLGLGAETSALHRALVPSHARLPVDSLLVPSSATLAGTFQDIEQVTMMQGLFANDNV